MTKTLAAKCEQWLLYEIPRHDRPTPAWLQVMSDGRFDARNLEMALHRLKKHGLAEKYWQPGKRPHQPKAWRLTAKGTSVLEEMELRAAGKL